MQFMIETFQQKKDESMKIGRFNPISDGDVFEIMNYILRNYEEEWNL